jgi:hypothetical protein
MFALRGLPQARQVARLPRQAAVFQQKRGMAGGGASGGRGRGHSGITGTQLVQLGSGGRVC